MLFKEYIFSFKISINISSDNHTLDPSLPLVSPVDIDYQIPVFSCIQPSISFSIPQFEVFLNNDSSFTLHSHDTTPNVLLLLFLLKGLLK